MWRYLVGAVAAMLLVAAGVVLSRGHSTPQSPLPAAPQRVAATAAAEDAAPLPERVPEASAKTREQKRFARVDKDRDSVITREEYLANRRKAFAKLDANHDGTLSFDEWSAKAIAKFAGADKNRSNTLTATEFATTAVTRKPRAGCPKVPAPREEDS